MNSNTLRNPSEDDFLLTEEQQESEQLTVDKDQLLLDVETPVEKFEGMISGFKMNLKRQEEILEISQLWKSPAPAFAIVSLLTILGILFIGGIVKYNEIGPTIPLFYDSISKQFIPTDKIFIFISATIIGLIEFAIFRFVFLVSKNDTRLSIVICWLIFFFNILMLAGIGQFYTIIV